ncbi:phytoene/squalene synthase family protein [uncultured Corynebacterium sp.]|uniref:phytoene/squalene synthase family protein n=1 Tax=uncultured Corynebacterium sp. TaxID=159447 RepID=UPI002593DD0D|nr:phytoene/squalene synthase family protein [uncultured Corynebacterium sp.]
MADRAAAQVIAQYSTSFSLATKVLAPGVRRDIRNFYAVVRIADEIVDGAAQQANADPETLLNAYEEQVLQAPNQRFHTDPVLHAWANTYRRCRLNAEHLEAFFASMRADLNPHVFSPAELETYIYGSAEVIGLMCLDIFFPERQTPHPEKLQRGARALGAAFQRINFLRDFGEDQGSLGRAYFGRMLDDDTKHAITTTIHTELDQALEAIPLLPRGVRGGVAAAEALFRELTEIAERTPAAQLTQQRISVPQRRKVALTAKAIARVGL